MDDMLSTAHARVGEEIGGKYRLEALVGVGGTAAVYAATHRNGHRVAVKISHRKVYASPALWARFLRESYLGNVLDHEGVVRVLDDDVTQDGAAYLVMELLEGASLRTIAAELPLDVAYVAAVGDAVLEVLAIAHQKGIVHRDVKPENIFLTDEGVLKLLDFGVARQLSSYGPAVTTSGAILGTPAFMAPEQVLGRGPLLGPPTDLWSVGATLFTLLSGQHVHEGSTTGEVFVSAATCPARPIASVVAGCPPAFCAVIDKALRREIEARWGDASTMRAALGEAFQASFGKPLDAKALLERMARELLPLVAAETSSGRADVGEPDEPAVAPTQSSNWADSPRSPGPRASGYRDLPLTLRDVTSSQSPDQSSRLKHFGGDSIDGIAPTERAPETPPLISRVVPAARHLLFQDRTLVSQSDTPPRLGGWAKTALAVAGLIAASAAMGFGMSRTRTKLAVQGEAPAASVEARAPVPTAPQGGSEAEVAYGEAFQLWLDGAPSRARTRFLDAARLNPSLAAARLYAIVVSPWVDMGDREHFIKARALRSKLPAREAGLLEALEPMMDEPSRPAEAEARLERWAQAFPNDAVTKLVLGQVNARARHTDRLIALAPEVGGAVGHWFAATAHLQREDGEASARELERCVAASAGAVDCLESLVQLETNEGRCAAAEKTARKLIASNHESPNGYRYLARAVMGQTHSTEATRAILRSRWSRLPAENRNFEAADEFFLHVYDGEFDQARRDVARWQEAVAGTADAWQRGYVLESQIDLELELGNAEGAARLARTMELAGRGWLPDEQYDPQVPVDRALYITGQIEREEFERRRALTAERLFARGGQYAAQPGLLWYDLYASGAKDPLDARHALDKVPPVRPLIESTSQARHISSALGRVHLLGGDLNSALRELKRATAACAYAESIEGVRAFLALGDALAKAGDGAGACGAYAEVIARWGRDARSVTARAAREHAAAAGCPAQRPPTHLTPRLELTGE